MNGLFDDIDLSSGAEEVAEVAYADVPPEAEDLLSEAMRRIEQAQLYKTLLGHSLFAPGSARQDIQENVEAEIRAFVLTRLEILVGVRKEQSAPAFSSEFSEDEVLALKSLAQKVLNRSAPAQPPVANPQINPVPAFNNPQMAAPRTRQAATPAGQAVPVKPKGKVRSGSKNIGENSGKDRSQAVPTQRKPIPMPSATRINQIAASETQNSMGNMENDPTGKGGLLKAIAQIAIKQNAGVSED